MVLRGPLKFLGTLLVVLIILATVLGVAAYVTVRNLDPNMFRSEIEKQIMLHTGLRTELGEIRLSGSLRPQLQVLGLKFYHPQKPDILLQAVELRIDADLRPLLQKKFRVRQVLLQDPAVFIKRGPEGAWNWRLVRPASVPAHASRPSGGLIPIAEAAEDAGSPPAERLGPAAPGWAFGFDAVLFRNGTIQFTDETFQPPLEAVADKIDVRITQRASDGIFHFEAGAALFGSPRKDLDWKVDLDLERQALDVHFQYRSAQIDAKGLFKVERSSPRFEGSLDVRDLDILSVTPEAYKQKEHLSGRLSVQARAAFQGLRPREIKQSLQGNATATITDGALRNRNLIREVFDRLHSALAFTGSWDGGLPPEIAAMLKERDTPFQTLKISCLAGEGSVDVNDFQLTHPDYALAGLGTYGLLTETVDGSMSLLLSKSISDHFTGKIHEMQILLDKNGQLAVPFRIGGKVSDVTVQPDLNALASKLFQKKKDELLMRGAESLSKALGTRPGPAAQKPASEKDQMIQQGIALLSQLMEPAPNEKNTSHG